MEPDKAIFSSALVTLSSTTAASAMPTVMGGHGELPPFRMLFGTSITFLGLSIMGDIMPQVAVPLSVSIAITALTYYGLPILDAYFSNDPATLARATKGRKGARQLSRKTGVPLIRRNVPSAQTPQGYAATVGVAAQDLAGSLGGFNTP